MSIFLTHRVCFWFDPDGHRNGWGGRSFSYKSFWVRLISRAQNRSSGLLRLIGQTVMNNFRCEQTDPGVVMCRVIPREKLPSKAAAILDTTKTVGKIRAILQGLELRFRDRALQYDILEYPLKADVSVPLSCGLPWRMRTRTGRVTHSRRRAFPGCAARKPWHRVERRE